jgi:hypothetical protein
MNTRSLASADSGVLTPKMTGPYGGYRYRQSAVPVELTGGEEDQDRDDDQRQNRDEDPGRRKNDA